MGDAAIAFPKKNAEELVKDALAEEGGEITGASAKAVSLINRCSAEFLRLIVSEAAEVCAQSKKQLMKPEHVQLALERLGFEYLASSVGEAEVKGKEEVAAASKDKRKRKPKLTDRELAELAAAQEAMFEALKTKMNG